MTVRPVILSGGSGTRLWPLSTQDRPKQFVDLVPGGGSLFAATLGRLDGVEGSAGPIVVAGAGHLPSVDAEMTRAGIGDGTVVVEPTGRNTAPAVAAAALIADPDDVLVILPSDHLVADIPAFRSAVVSAVSLAGSGAIVSFGIEPDRPETGYGYIEVGEQVGPAHLVSRFKEKPESEEAEQMVADGRHLWNSGMFVGRAGGIVDTMGQTCPDLLDGVRDALPSGDGQVIRLGPAFARVESISFDHAVMERIDSALVLPIDVGWDDIGSFLALHQRLPQDEQGNVVSGAVILDGVDRSLVMAASRVVAVAGMSDVVVVETPEAVLVIPMSRAQRVKDLAERADGR